MSRNWHQHLLADATANPNTRATLATISDLKSERLATSDEALRFMKRCRRVEAVKDALTSLGDGVGHSPPNAFTEMFLDNFSLAVRNGLTLKVLLQSKDFESCQKVAALHFDINSTSANSWGTIEIGTVLSSPTLGEDLKVTPLAYVSIDMSPAETLHEYLDALLGESVLSEVSSKTHRVLLGRLTQRIPLTLHFNKGDGHAISGDLSAIVSEVLSIPSLKISKFDLEILAGMCQLLDLEEQDSADISFADLINHSQVLTNEIEMSLESIVDCFHTTWLTKQDLNFGVRFHKILERAKDELTERTIWAERRISIAYVEQFIAYSGLVAVDASLLDDIVLHLDSKIGKDNRLAETMQIAGLPPRLIEKQKKMVEDSLYLKLAIIKNRQFLNNFFT